MASIAQLTQSVQDLLGTDISASVTDVDELTIVVDSERITDICTALRDDDRTRFEQLIDLCAVDYSVYGEGYPARQWTGSRYAVVYHLLSVSLNHRLRVKVYIDEDHPVVRSVTDIWPAADWFEREAFDLFGILFEGHSDLRRILTDYGFIGHPFRKDFPLTGYVEMRYDPGKGRVVYEPVTIEPRTLVPRVIREDSFGDRDS
ncbi:MAG: NADH-quinone oxidoreductase subunit C [Acidiferrobacterales bacterium]|nr:NADH-quinone oxidoreductase subunit C [Acidiferrobacterales bacterium]